LWVRKNLTPEQAREDRLLRQWRQSQRLRSLENLLLSLPLRSQCRSLADTEAARLETMGLLPARQKLRRQIVKKMRSASGWLVTKPAAWLNRRRCLQPVRRWLVNLRRKLLVKACCLPFRLMRSQSRR
jgi:hypothetical protein